jgi:large subunit ribosomal protein L24
MKIKKSDLVKMISGKDKNKTGKVLRVDVSEKKVVVEGLNLVKKHRRPRREGEKGQRVEIPRPVSVSSVAVVCPKCGKATRIGYKKTADKKFRVCKKCKAEI